MKAAGRVSVISTQNAPASARQGAIVKQRTFFGMSSIVAFHLGTAPGRKVLSTLFSTFHHYFPVSLSASFSITGRSPLQIPVVGAFSKAHCASCFDLIFGQYYWNQAWL